MKRDCLNTAFLLATLAISSNNVGYTMGDSQQETKPNSSPFSVTIVPSWSQGSGPACKSSCRGISMAANTLDTFYVLLTNVSTRPQAVFKPSNSWGYYAISFELRTSDQRIVTINRKQAAFTKNNPATFVIFPGEQMIYPIKLDDAWIADSRLPIANEEPADVTLKAIYKIVPTPDASQTGVWTGRIESKRYHFQFRHWVN